ncbi:transcription antitermination factor NusB [Maritalea sp.]|jgi:N utilization substance protein B|uniref:transcription antitermination factor NusB n=1 Tax=Maritalea sp. TaxID=2003361 RepID=UPI0039E3F5C4
MTDDKPQRDPGKANQRGAARLAAVQALYQMDVGRAPLDATLEQFKMFHLGKEVEGDEYLPADADYFKQILEGVRTYQVKIDPIIDNSLVDGWPVTRIDSTLRAILRSAAFEMLYKKDVPARVVINEYVDVARAFFGKDQPAMVNGVLNNIATIFRADELK